MSTIPVLFAQKRCLGADVIVGRTETTTRMVLGVLAQPVPQCAVWALGRRCAGFVTLGSTLLPGDAAGEPFADRQHSLEMTNGARPHSGLRRFPSRSPAARPSPTQHQPATALTSRSRVRGPRASGVLGLQTAELVTPAVIAGLRHPEIAAHRRGVLTLDQQPIRGHQLARNPFRAMPLPHRHDLVEPSCPQHGPQDPHEPCINRSGSGHGHHPRATVRLR